MSWLIHDLIKGWCTYDIHLQGQGWGLRQKWDIIGRRVVGVSQCSGCPIFFFFLKENWILAMTRHYANNILLARNLHFDSDVSQWSHRLMILLHCLWAKSNYRTCGLFECDVTLFLFWFCPFTCMMRSLFHSLFTFSRYANKTGWLQNEY